MLLFGKLLLFSSFIRRIPVALCLLLDHNLEDRRNSGGYIEVLPQCLNGWVLMVVVCVFSCYFSFFEVLLDCWLLETGIRNPSGSGPLRPTVVGRTVLAPPLRWETLVLSSRNEGSGPVRPGYHPHRKGH